MGLSRSAKRVLWFVLLCLTVVCGVVATEEEDGRRKHAYVAMMYMGTPRDYEFYVATRVMMRSLARLGVDADRVVLASVDVPARWVHTMQKEDGLKVVSVENLRNPYEKQGNFDKRFKLTLNKLYAWSLVHYDRVVMLDSDNIFLQKTDELFQCGEFCAVFINPCIFHTGLFVLQPSTEVFKNMIHEVEIGRENPDGADQGFLAGYFPDLLGRPMFNPPENGTKLVGTYRLPLGYQMDASYYYLKLRWSIPCGPNSVITFPSAPWLKPWYWWSWPVLPLGLSWHEQRRQNLGYGSEMPVILIQSLLYVGIIAVTRLARPSLSKLCYNRRPEKSTSFLLSMLKVATLWSMLAAYTVPFFLIPRTIHPLLGWPLYLLGSAALNSIVINVFLLPPLAVLTTWLGLVGALFVMAYPYYSDGLVRALVVFMYAFCCSPVVWASLVKIMGSLQVLVEREAYFPRLGEPNPPTAEFTKLY
ncbi:Nucleotide-diphospho-sugar transferases superfamily protein [Rhynchospora pubera]|uniref:Nucleotide-diphospho-sugar transferases superfamily protein n=1 Tax=Rhynchospora pubera TaxID=906938 RepID=A0AAV8BUS7_9POAL|nr:Nucleotide-diphospho-sugar transferases superfamily protein [Rhynchospora pubera]